MTIRVECGACGHRFDVDRSLAGGLANCPSCGHLVTVEGGQGRLFWLLVAGGAVVATGLAFLVGAAAGATAGLVCAGILGGLLVIGVLAS